MLHHITIWVPDLERADESWSWLLGELGYTRDDSSGPVLLFRHPVGFTLALEQSDDMVPGMLHSRLRPGMNHLAFVIPMLVISASDFAIVQPPRNKCLAVV